MALTETQQTKASVKINHVPTDADVQTLFNNGSFNPGEIIVTPDEDVNLDCLRTEIVYDMNDNLKNWGYPSGIENGVNVSGKNFTKYEKLIFTCANFTVANTDANCSVVFVDLKVINPNKNQYEGSGVIMLNRSSIMFGDCVRIYVDAAKTSLIAYMTEYTTSGSYTAGDVKIIKIEGVLKEPAMIYTGAELHEGLGVKIKNGVVSSEHPIGSYHICATGSENPASLFGGTWTQLATNVVIPLGGTVSGTAAEQYMYTSNTNGSTTCTFYVSAGSGVLNYLKIYNAAGFKGSDSGAWLGQAYTTMDLSTTSQRLEGVDIWWRSA